MNDKKKFLVKLSLLFGLLFCLLLGFSSTTCYAGVNDDFSQDEVNQINSFFNLNYSLNNYNDALNYLKSKYPSLNKLNIFFAKNGSDNKLYILPNNGTASNTLDYVYVGGNAYTAWFYYIPDINNVSSNTSYAVIINNGNLTYTMNNTINYYYDYNHPTLDGVILTCPLFLTTFATQSFYYKNPSNDENISVFSSNYINLDGYSPEPEEPSGDDGGGGTVTPSGDSSGDNSDMPNYTPILNDINSNISNQGTAIINNQNENTDKLIENQNKNADILHNDLTNYDTDEGEEDVSSLIDNISSTLSGDLSNSEIFGALEETENGFLNLISGQAEDFEIHWNDVFYNGVKLIPAGQVNFSKICRENETLGNVKEKLNIILSALCGLALIKYLYNLLLATLGIDNPYLYDNSSDGDYIKSVDKNTGVTTFRGVDKDGTRWSYSYNPSSKGGKKK